MSKYDFFEELKDKMGMTEGNVERLYYPFNLFLDAMGMNIKKGGYSSIFTFDLPNKYCVKSYESEKLKYRFEILNDTKMLRKNYFVFRGKYNDDLLFNLHLAYGKTIDNEEVLPFLINMGNVADDQSYNLCIRVISNNKTMFRLERNPLSEDDICDSLVFYSNRVDFENIFNVIKVFVSNPDTLYFAYKEIMNQKEVYFNDLEVNCLENNDILVTNKGKIMQKVLNNQK